MKKTSVLFVVFFTFSFFLFPETEGEKLFLRNEPARASVLLESEIASGTASAIAWNYLGLCYYQTGDYDKAISTFQRGLSVSGTNKKILAFNAGNAAYAKADYVKAIEYFNLSFSMDPSYEPALLNRANCYLMSAAYDKALEDYRTFLTIAPNDVQAGKVRQMISALEEEILRIEEQKRQEELERIRLAEEEKRLEEELARQKAEREAEEARLREERLREEERRLAEEKARREEEERILAEKRAAEAERRRKLLEEVANSLLDSESTSFTSGAEDIVEYEQESELD